MNFPALSNAAMFTPGQLLVASQTAALMAASGLGLPGANAAAAAAALFHPGLFSPWGAQLSQPASRSPPHHNNNNNDVVTSSSADLLKPVKKKQRRTQKEDMLPSPPMMASPAPAASPAPSTGADSGARHDKQFTCGVCHRSFGYKHVLQNHERTHTGEKPFECPECHKRFTRDHHLKTHMRLHTGERPYHCEYCDRQFVQVANLRRHLRVHTGERPYACQYCAARFSDSNQLKAHVLIHKGEKPFECERCSGRFRRRHHLLHHKCVNGQASSVKSVASPPSDEFTEEAMRRRLMHQGCKNIASPPASDLSDELSYGEGQRRLTQYPVVPEQTEPEDLSMSTGVLSHSRTGSSGADSPRSASGTPDSSPGAADMDLEELDDAAALFLQRRPPC